MVLCLIYSFALVTVAAVDKHLLTVGHGHGFKRPCSANKGGEDRRKSRAERRALALAERLKITEVGHVDFTAIVKDNFLKEWMVSRQ